MGNIAQRKPLEERIEEARELERQQHAEQEKAVQNPYVKAQMIDTQAGRMFELLNCICMEEYFQALSAITGDERDAQLPQEIRSCKDCTVEEVLYKECQDVGEISKRIYKVLIEPFAKIQEVLYREIQGGV